MNGLMHPDRVGLRSALLVIAALIGVAIGALAGYGCSQSTQRRDPLPIATAHRTPRVAPVADPPEAIRSPVESPNTFEDRPAVPSAEPDVRVRIAAFREPGGAPRLAHTSGTLLLVNASGTVRALRTPVDVRCSESGLSITEGAGTAGARTTTTAGRKPVEFRAPKGAHAVLAFGGNDWPGAIRVVPLAESPAAMDLVVDVPLERYLPGVLARELFKNWSPETFRAQAIAARSYAICEQAQWAHSRHFDLIAGEASQAWIGEVKDPRPRAAVADTRGMVLMFDNLVVPAYYSSTCGGTPANAVDSLTRNPHYGIAPLLAGTDVGNAHRDCCRSAPRFRWEQTMPVSRVLTQLRKWSKDQLADGRTAVARAMATPALPNGTLLLRTETPIPAAELASAVPSRTVIEGSVLPTGAPPAVAEVATDAPLHELAKVSGLQSIVVLAANQAGRPVRVRLVDAQGRVLDMRAEDFRRAVNYAAEGEPTPKDRLNSSAFQAEVAGAVVRFKGAGFGHGVGMCQFGAEAMAQKGASAPQILRTYYPGATIRTAY
jgi:stage II sporulation protein D